MICLFGALVVGTALASCAGQTPPPAPAVETPAAIVEAPEPAPPAPKAAIGTFGFDTAGMDRSVQPGDDFYEYSNGTWAKNTTIPSDKSNYGMFTGLADLSQQRVRDLLEATKDDPNSKIGTAYLSFLDEFSGRGQRARSDRAVAQPDSRPQGADGLCRAQCPSGPQWRAGTVRGRGRPG